RYRMVFQNILSSAAMEDFVLDFFWWLFLQSFQPDAGVQDSLFARVAEGYMQILGQHLASQSGSQFLREFPSTLAQTLYCCFISSFPQSAGTIRTDSFLLTVCFTAYQWTGGLCPAPDAHARWDLEALEPEEARNVVLVSSEKEDKDEDSCLSLLDTMFSDSGVEPGHSQSSVALLSKKISRTTQGSSQASLKSQRLSSGSRVTVKEEKAGGPDITGHDLKGLTSEETQKPTIESHVAYPATEFERVMFDLRGNSPLVKFYLDQANRSPCRGSQLLLNVPILYTSNREHWAHHSRDLGAMRGQYAQDLYNLHHKKLDERYRFHRKQKKVLSQKSMVRRLCQLLVPEGNEEDLRARSDVIRLFETTLSGLD
ncbi:protein FAM227B-like, partial [Aplochiton taeniatus]